MKARGFTLVELLLAIAIMGLLAILSWRGLDGMVRAQEGTRQHADEMLVLQAALGQWGADLDALQPIAHTTPLDWDGQVLRMTRRDSGDTGLESRGIRVVAWTRLTGVALAGLPIISSSGSASGAAVEMLSIVIAMWPPSRSVMTGAAPR